MRVVNLDQKSDDWHLWRRKGVGSSDANVVLKGKAFNKTVQDLWLEKTGRQGDNFQANYRMQRGIELEPVARELYARFFGFRPEPLCGVHDKHDWLRSSLDGWDPVRRILIEIKCPYPDYKGYKVHREALADRIPEYYRAQVDHHALVTGAELVHYVSYIGDEEDIPFDPLERFVVVAHPVTAAGLKYLEDAEAHFWKHVEDDTPPGDCPECGFYFV